MAHLDEPLTLRSGLVLPHRIVKAPMTENLADADNQPTPALEQLYRRWAQGAAGGLLVTGNLMVDRRFLERTRNVVADVAPGRSLTWDTTSSGARWIWELIPEGEGTRVVHRRPVPRRLTPMSKVFAAAFLGGATGHADELEEGMAASVRRLKSVVETD